MSYLRISLCRIMSFGSGLCSQVGPIYCCAARELEEVYRKWRRFAVTRGCLGLQRARRQTVPRLLYASLVALTGCATSAELESLRAEVAKANAVAARAEAGVSKTQRQLAALKNGSEPPESLSKPSTTPTKNSPETNGYKWGRLQQD